MARCWQSGSRVVAGWCQICGRMKAGWCQVGGRVMVGWWQGSGKAMAGPIRYTGFTLTVSHPQSMISRLLKCVKTLDV